MKHFIPKKLFLIGIIFISAFSLSYGKMSAKYTGAYLDTGGGSNRIVIFQSNEKPEVGSVMAGYTCLFSWETDSKMTTAKSSRKNTMASNSKTTANAKTSSNSETQSK